MTDTTEPEEPGAGDRRRAVNRLTDDPKEVYCCSWCNRYIGSRSAVQHYDKYDRVCCSQECGMKLFDHPSRLYEGRGGDY